MAELVRMHFDLEKEGSQTQGALVTDGKGRTLIKSISSPFTKPGMFVGEMFVDLLEMLHGLRLEVHISYVTTNLFHRATMDRVMGRYWADKVRRALTEEIKLRKLTIDPPAWFLQEVSQEREKNRKTGGFKAGLKVEGNDLVYFYMDGNNVRDELPESVRDPLIKMLYKLKDHLL